jgi:hypothetical protein
MVHALERASDMVRRGGVLIVVHDCPIPPSIEIHQGTSHSIAGWLYDIEGFPFIREADKAVDRLIESGQAALVNHRLFPYHTQIDSYDGFCEWLDKQWETSYLPAHIDQRIKGRFLAGGTETTVFIYRQARIQSLKIL